MAQPGVVDLGEKRMRVQDEAYQDGWQEGRHAGFSECLEQRDYSEKWVHERRMQVNRRYAWVYLASTALLSTVLYSRREPRLHDFLLIVIGITFALTFVHLRRWDKHRIEYRYLKHRQRS